LIHCWPYNDYRVTIWCHLLHFQSMHYIGSYSFQNGCKYLLELCRIALESSTLISTLTFVIKSAYEEMLWKICQSGCMRKIKLIICLLKHLWTPLISYYLVDSQAFRSHWFGLISSGRSSTSISLHVSSHLCLHLSNR